MLAILTTTGRVLWRHWPALLVWFIAGITARYFIIQLAGWIGGHVATFGMLLLPLAVLARLVSFVGMFLVVREALRNLQAIAPVPESARERRTMFLGSLMASILPFFAVYTAAGHLREDAAEYARIALDVASGIGFLAAVTGGEVADSDVALEVSLGPWTLLIIAIAFSGRWAWKKWSAKLPRVTALLAVYLEVIWIAFAVALISDAVESVSGWVDRRVAMVWLADVRAWVGEQLVPLAWIWDGIEWLLGEIGAIVIQPLAWLMIAGVIYGQTIVAEKLRIEHAMIARAKARAERVPGVIRRRTAELGDELASRFKPMGRALLLMWRAGPVLITGYILLYTLVLAIQPLLERGIVTLIGPHELTFWVTFSTLIATAPILIAEPVRIAIVAGAYDATLKATRPARVAAQDGSIENRTNLPSWPVPPVPPSVGESTLPSAPTSL
ncbi:hypothetical protein [Microbacterium hydrocarbonoxydans]|uniref:hypothetical protein n=1 Tax=Microbacterium hydrocarbonoxydans TaxID=273678 RepID=UPI0007BC2490|nr:hypothetical protein [Microbacterium hydrocarbonoxydans]GAT74136.1 hypothetical protein MHM582_2637 [Microbacterium sp. HM58-2]